MNGFPPRIKTWKWRCLWHLLNSCSAEVGHYGHLFIQNEMLVNSIHCCLSYPFVAESNFGASLIKVKKKTIIHGYCDITFLPYGFAFTWQLLSVFLCKCVILSSHCPSSPTSSPTMYLLSMETVSLTEGPGENSISILPDY